MTKAEVVEGLIRRLGISNAEAEKAVNVILEEISEALARGERVTISGFGTFTVSSRKPRTGRNPKTGEPIQIPGSRSAKFRAGKQLKETLSRNNRLSGVQEQSTAPATTASIPTDLDPYKKL